MQDSVPPSAEIKRIVYLSRAVRPMSEPDLSELLETARTFNESVGITGVLMFERGHFLQVLEGEDKAVVSLFDHIKSDSRHGGVQVLIDDVIPERQFGEWSMAWSRVEDPDLLNQFDELRSESASSILIGSDLGMMRRFLAVLHGLLPKAC